MVVARNFEMQGVDAERARLGADEPEHGLADAAPAAAGLEVEFVDEGVETAELDTVTLAQGDISGQPAVGESQPDGAEILLAEQKLQRPATPALAALDALETVIRG